MFDSTISHPLNQLGRTTFTSTATATPSPEASATPSVPSTSQHTPRPMTAPTFTYRNYSPTASVGGESLSRQLSNQTPPVTNAGTKTQSAHFQETLEGPPFISSNMLTRSLYASPTSGTEDGRPRGNQKGVTPQSASIKSRFEKFFSIFSSRKSPGAECVENEEIYTCERHRPTGQHGTTPSVGGVSGAQVMREGDCEGRGGEMGVEATEEENSASGLTSSEDSGPIQAEGGMQGEERDDVDNAIGDTAVLSNTMPRLSISEPQSPHLPASFPGRTQFDSSKQVHRKRASQSDSVSHTVLQVQERLKQLAESQTLDEMSDKGRGEKRGCNSPNSHQHSLLPSEERDSSKNRPIDTVDSTNTLIGSISSPNFIAHHVALARSLDTNETGETPLSGSLKRERKFSGILMRRVSVCDRKGVNFGTQTSTGGLEGSPVDIIPSPVALLDQLVIHGEIMHEGNAQDIPLTELEGIDWFRFGGCPHNEELGQMQSQVALLHSQLLFERYQCLQHARRNRRLLSKARSAHRVREELEYLVRYKYPTQRLLAV